MREWVEKGGLGGLVLQKVAVEIAAALSIADVDLVGRQVAGAGLEAVVDEGLEQHEREVETLDSILLRAGGGQGEDGRGELLDVTPGRQE